MDVSVHEIFADRQTLASNAVGTSQFPGVLDLRSYPISIPELAGEFGTFVGVGGEVDTSYSKPGQKPDPNVDGSFINIRYGSGSHQVLYIGISDTFAGGNSTTVDFSLKTADSVSGTNEGNDRAADKRTMAATAPTLISTGPVGISQLKSGMYAILPLPCGPLVPYRRYLALFATVAGAAITASGVNAFLTRDPDDWYMYTARRGQLIG